MKPQVIGLYSPAPQCGKSAVAARLQSMHGYTLVKFAGALKYMLFALFQYTTGADNQTAMDHIEGKHKNAPLDWAGGKSMRQLMQTLGTEWGRVQVDPDLWVGITQQRIMHIVSQGGSVVVDDMRFENEFQMISELPLVVETINIRRDVAQREYKNTHESEGKLEGMPFTQTIVNNGTLARLNARATAALTYHTSTPEKL